MVFDVTLAGALLAGVLSFLSPCVLPIVPFYLSYLAGVGVDALRDDVPIAPGVQRRAAFAAILFSLGVATIFVALGATATALGQVVRDWFDVLRYVAVAIFFALGLHFLGVMRIGILYRHLGMNIGAAGKVSLPGAYVIGLAFAFGWTPCVGPVLAAILFMAASQGDVGQGVALLTAYAVGMTAPFVLAAAFIRPFLRWMQRFHRRLPMIEKALGTILILFGLLVGTETINWIANWMAIYWPQIG